MEDQPRPPTPVLLGEESQQPRERNDTTAGSGAGKKEKKNPQQRRHQVHLRHRDAATFFLLGSSPRVRTSGPPVVFSGSPGSSEVALLPDEGRRGQEGSASTLTLGGGEAVGGGGGGRGGSQDLCEGSRKQGRKRVKGQAGVTYQHLRTKPGGFMAKTCTKPAAVESTGPRHPPPQPLQPL